MGGSLSHEYHYTTEIGEEVISTCLQCNYTGKQTENEQCPNCKNDAKLMNESGIEVS